MNILLYILAAIFALAVVKASVTDRYIVLLHPSLSDHDEQSHHHWVRRQYQDHKPAHSHNRLDRRSPPPEGILHTINLAHRGVRGYIGSFSPTLARNIAASSDVIVIEQDAIETLQHVDVQLNAPWGISRVSRKSQAAIQGAKYIYRYDSRAGANTTVYVLDTGIDTSHLEFRPGRAAWGANFADDNLEYDDNGHGTHVAGVIAGKMFGVAKKADVVAVKVFDGDGIGSVSGFIKAVEWVVLQHEAKEAAGDNARTIVNYSASGVISEARTAVVKAALQSNIVFVTAAGNGGSDACLVGPANVNANISESSSLLVVGAIDSTDAVASYSNIGDCVNIFAPGTGIRSAYPVNGTRHGSRVLTGTSTASPHAAGVVASLWAAKPDWSAVRIAQTVARINQGDIVIGNLGGAQNSLAYDLVEELQI
ncbi:peptidase S8/S53 domain-containing protein [Lipomyces tetrasporus]